MAHLLYNVSHCYNNKPVLVNEDGVEVTLGNGNDLFSLFCMAPIILFERRSVSSRFAIVELEVPIRYLRRSVKRIMTEWSHLHQHRRHKKAPLCKS